MDLKTSSVNAYISSFPENIQPKLEQIRKLILEMAPDAEEFISYGMPAYKLNGKRLAYFAGNKKHVGFYPYPTGVDEFKKHADSESFVTTKGGIQLPYDRELPVALIRKVMQFRIQEAHKASQK